MWYQPVTLMDLTPVGMSLGIDLFWSNSSYASFPSRPAPLSHPRVQGKAFLNTFCYMTGSGMAEQVCLLAYQPVISCKEIQTKANYRC